MIFLGIFLRDHRLGNDQSIEKVEDKEKNDSLDNFLKKYFTVSNKQRSNATYITSNGTVSPQVNVD